MYFAYRRNVGDPDPVGVAHFRDDHEIFLLHPSQLKCRFVPILACGNPAPWTFQREYCEHISSHRQSIVRGEVLRECNAPRLPWLSLWNEYSTLPYEPLPHASLVEYYETNVVGDNVFPQTRIAWFYEKFLLEGYAAAGTISLCPGSYDDGYEDHASKHHWKTIATSSESGARHGYFYCSDDVGLFNFCKVSDDMFTVIDGTELGEAEFAEKLRAL